MSRVLVDTSVIIDYLRMPDKTETRFYSLLDNYRPVISIITHTELHAGKSVWQRNDAKTDLTKLLQGCSIIDLNEEISSTAGRLFAIHKVPIIDAIIAATALVEDIPLVTRNTSDFATIPDLRML